MKKTGQTDNPAERKRREGGEGEEMVVELTVTRAISPTYFKKKNYTL